MTEGLTPATGSTSQHPNVNSSLGLDHSWGSGTWWSVSEAGLTPRLEVEWICPLAKRKKPMQGNGEKSRL
jgi:hypothetical protein